MGRLPDEAQAQDLRRLFEQYGIVTECDILNRYGFVHMKTEEMAVRAIKELNNAEFMGVQISVEVFEIIFNCFPDNQRLWAVSCQFGSYVCFVILVICQLSA